MVAVGSSVGVAVEGALGGLRDDLWTAGADTSSLLDLDVSSVLELVQEHPREMAGREKQGEGGPQQPRPSHLAVGAGPVRPMGGHGVNSVKLGGGTPRPQHHSSNGGSQQGRHGGPEPTIPCILPRQGGTTVPSFGGLDGGSDGDKGLKMKIKRTKSGRQEIVKDPGEGNQHREGPPHHWESGQHGNNTHNGAGVTVVSDGDQSMPLVNKEAVIPAVSRVMSTPSSLPSHGEMNGTSVTTNGRPGLSNNGLQQLTTKRIKVDASTCTDASTLTEPEILGPCEPGTAVNLEGIVWHETDTGVLVVNVTWRGKTYVGTLLDCTRHTNQWSAPRFTDSPEPGGKGRAKRGRSAAVTPCEIEPRKNLRSSKGKGKGKNGKSAAAAASKEEEFNFPAPSSPATKGDQSGKRKVRPDGAEEEDNKKRKRTGSDTEDQDAGSSSCPEGSGEEPSTPPPPQQTVPRREPKPVVYSYKMFECPRKDCSKQYKQNEGLKWHLSHSHPEYIDSVTGQIKDAAQVEKEEQERKKKARMNKDERRREIKLESELKTDKSRDSKHHSASPAPGAKVVKLDQDKMAAGPVTSGSPKPTPPQKPLISRPPSSPGSPLLPGRMGAVSTSSGPTTLQTLLRSPGISTPQPIVSVQAPRQPGQLPPGLIAPNLRPTPPRPSFIGEAVTNPQVIELKKQQSFEGSPAGSPALVPTCSSPGGPLVVHEKPPANSPAYSDISDDGEDSRGSKVGDLKVVTISLSATSTSSSTGHIVSMASSGPAVQIIGSVSSALQPVSSTLPPEPIRATMPNLPPPPHLMRSSPVPRPEVNQRVSTPSSMTRPNSRPSPALYATSPSCGPSPGTPEYHKYLAANGFPPFPYPYPVGMDPNYHIQLLKTDHVYKAKWEKHRAEKEKDFKEQLDRDQGKFSGLSLIKEEKQGGGNLNSTPNRKLADKQPEDLRKREHSGDRERQRHMQSPMGISVKAEFRERDEQHIGVKREVKSEDQGVKPTMETRGPPPGPQTFGYMHPALVRPPYSMAGLPPPFDPIMSSLSPYGLPTMPGAPSPYLSPAHLASIRPPGPFSFPGDPMRSPFPGLPSPEDLARAGLPGGPPSMSGTKALDLLQQHASQYYANQKLAELQERALKSPSSSINSVSSIAASPTLAKPITTLAGKESPTPTTLASSGDKSKSPPPLRHVHTHTHTHIGLGYPLLPPGALPPVAGSGLAPPSLPPGAGLPPPPVGVVPAGMPPFSGSNSYPGKSPT